MTNKDELRTLLLDKGMEEADVNGLLDDLSEQQAFLLIDLARQLWRKATLFAVAQSQELLADYFQSLQKDR